MAKAVALLSGGLDSTLAVLLLRRQGIEVTAITFLTHFGCDIRDSSSCSSDPSENARRFGFEVKLSHLAEKFIDVVKTPKFGRGKNMNPCIDCRILMLKEAGEFMRMTGADFVATGEVVGQRPMSQMKNTLRMIDKHSGLKGYVLRPLSAKLLDPTIAEQEGLVDRELLCGFNGRSRKPQMALAKEFGLDDYPAPAGGCLLTDPVYSYRLKELLENNPVPSLKDFHLLRVGRHFRLKGGLKLVVGRNQQENAKIESLSDMEDCLLNVEGAGSPIAMISAYADRDDSMTAASICARYSDAKHLPRVSVNIKRGGEVSSADVSPAFDGMLDSLRIQKKPASGRQLSAI
jgi:tRNA U34 2-thiouridine synthase MnmA/TrmU